MNIEQSPSRKAYNEGYSAWEVAPNFMVNPYSDKKEANSFAQGWFDAKEEWYMRNKEEDE